VLGTPARARSRPHAAPPHRLAAAVIAGIGYLVFAKPPRAQTQAAAARDDVRAAGASLRAAAGKAKDDTGDFLDAVGRDTSSLAGRVGDVVKHDAHALAARGDANLRDAAAAARDAIKGPGV